MRYAQSIELQDIRYFVTLASTGSIAEAASLLQRDPTSVSRRLQALEQRLGVMLAERTTRSFARTEAGRSYLARVRPLLHEFDTAALEAASYATGEPRGHLRVAMPGSFARLWLDKLIVGFMRAYPAITLTACYSNDLVDMIGEGFDVAVRLAELEDSRLIARKVATRRRLAWIRTLSRS